MSSWVERQCEQRITEAMDRGDFDDLPGYGKPVAERDDLGVPEDLRLAYKLLRNAGYLPPEMSLQKEIRTLQDLLDRLTDEAEKEQLSRAINERSLRLNLLWKRAVYLETPGLLRRAASERYAASMGRLGVEHR